MRTRRIFFDLIYIVAIIGLISCAGQQTRVGSEKVVERSGDKPAWVKSEIDTFEKEGRLYFRAMTSKVKDLSIGMRIAKSEAIKNVMEMIKQRARIDFTNAVKGNAMAEDSIGRHMEDIITWTTDNIEFSGITPERSYWEKTEKITHSQVEYYYTIYTLLSMTKSDYDEAKMNAARNLEDIARKQRDKEAEEAAKLAQKRLLE